MTPKTLILVNFKKTTGKQAILLSEALDKASQLFSDQFTIAISIQPQDLPEIANHCELPIYIHDIYLNGPLEDELYSELCAISQLCGVLLNHPDKKGSGNDLLLNFQYAKKLKLKMIIAATNLLEACEIFTQYSPDFIAIESKDLIGQNISICNKYPELIESAIQKFSTKALFGAGVKTGMDINYIMEKCGGGILVSSAIINAENPHKALVSLLSDALHLKQHA